ncbi:MAG: OB-fold domain-containing protein [Desulfobacterales bacterium]|nr:OB-fold domain-containing protein [Desulfobacterales bacterium]
MSGEMIKRKEVWNITYEHSIGETASHFFNEIIRNRQLVGRYCQGCDRVLVPPRQFCDRCFIPTTDWRDVGKEGVIEAATIIYEQFKSLPEPPYALAYVRIDGASTAIGNFLKGIDFSNQEEALEKIKIGNRVKVKFQEDLEGSILDFWFELA